MNKTAANITQRFLDALKEGTVPWHKPWASIGLPMNLVSKRPYSGVNVMILAFSGYGSPYWMTYKQATQLGGNVKKGEKSTVITYVKSGRREVEDEKTGEKEQKKFWLLRTYLVFNLEQTEGVAAPPTESYDHDPIAAGEMIWKNYKDNGGPSLNRKGNEAYYSPREDAITVPKLSQFKQVEYYYSTLFHEMTHSTGHADRLDREGINPPHRFGTENYSKEELVAELGAAFLCGVTGIENAATFNNSASYLRSWLGRLTDDPSLIISAASQAQKAFDLITKDLYVLAPRGAEDEDSVALEA